MGQLLKNTIRGAALLPAALLAGAAAYAQDADIEARLAALEEGVAGSASAYVDNSYLFLIGGIIVMLMAAGFCMLEAGLVRSKNAAMQSTKNVALYSIAGLMFWVVGYNMAYPAESIGGLLGTTPGPWDGGDLSVESDAGYAPASDWFFQMVFVATAASIVSGTVAERVKLWPFLIFTAILTAFIYPVVVSWEWGAGYLDSAWGFSDFAGSTLVHSTGGWAALMGALIIGPRLGRYTAKGMTVFPGSSIPLATLGTFILWLGWFGFNGASQLAMGTVSDVSDVSKIFVNTNMAAAAGVVVAIILTQLRYGKADTTMALNGALAGLVAITAEPLTPNVGMAIVIGGIGGALPVIFVPLLDKLKIDDVVGAIPVHLVAGIWGTLAVPLTNTEVPFIAQLTGVVATGAFVCITSAIVWFALKATIGVRPSEEEELAGLDVGETGIEAYPEFSRAN